MATRFELVLRGEDTPRLKAAGDEAVGEIRRWHSRLSFFDRASDISRLNAHAAAGPVRIDAELFELLAACEEYWRLTRGAFDPAIGAAMRAAGFRESERSEEALRGVRESVGFDRVHMDRAAKNVRYGVPGVLLDLGAIGKGWALDRAAEVLRDAGVASAFLHGGTSSVVAFTAEDDPEPWRIAAGPRPGAPVIVLRNGALGVSSPSGRTVGGHGHVLDPRSGASAAGLRLAAVVSGSGAAADALSTALLVDGGGVSWLPEGVTALEESEKEPGGAWCVYGVAATLNGRQAWTIERGIEENAR